MEYGNSIFVTFNEHEKVPYCFSLGHILCEATGIIVYLHDQYIYIYMQNLFSYVMQYTPI